VIGLQYPAAPLSISSYLLAETLPPLLVETAKPVTEDAATDDQQKIKHSLFFLSGDVIFVAVDAAMSFLIDMDDVANPAAHATGSEGCVHPKSRFGNRDHVLSLF
jgi:hypothetical protein